MNEAALAVARAASSSSSSLGDDPAPSWSPHSLEQSHVPLLDDSMEVDADSESHSVNDHNIPFIEKYPGAAQTFGRAKTFMDTFDADRHADQRKDHPYYPFASRNEWEFASFLLCSNLSMNSIDKFLNLELVSGSVGFTFLSNIEFQVKALHLSFRSAKDLRNRAELLPKGPEWKSLSITPVYPTKNKIQLFYRDPVECLQMLMRNPLLKDHLEFEPFHIFKTAEKLMRIYTEWLSGDMAWSMQVRKCSFR